MSVIRTIVGSRAAVGAAAGGDVAAGAAPDAAGGLAAGAGAGALQAPASATRARTISARAAPLVRPRGGRCRERSAVCRPAPSCTCCIVNPIADLGAAADGRPERPIQPSGAAPPFGAGHRAALLARVN